MTPSEHAARIREALEWQSSLGAPAWTTAGRTITAALEALSTLEAQAAESVGDAVMWESVAEDARAERDAALAQVAELRECFDKLYEGAKVTAARLEATRQALRQAQDYCARPKGVCFDPALAGVSGPAEGVSEPEAKHLTPSEPGQGSRRSRASSGDERNSPAPRDETEASGSLTSAVSDPEPDGQPQAAAVERTQE